MKTKHVLEKLGVTRATLSGYVSSGKIEVRVMANGRYDYDEASVFKFLNKNYNRISIGYARVSTKAQKKSLMGQVQEIETFCKSTGVVLSKMYSEVGSGIEFDRDEFQTILDLAFSHKVENLYVTYRDRLSRISFSAISKICSSFGCRVIVINESKDTDEEEEIFEDIIAMLHVFSMRSYAKRTKIEKLKDAAQKEAISE